MSSLVRKGWILPALCVLLAACALMFPDAEDRLQRDRYDSSRLDRYDSSRPDRYDRSRLDRYDRSRYDHFRQVRDGRAPYRPAPLRGNADDSRRHGYLAGDPVVLGADLSYVNEMEECGGVYREDGQAVDPFVLFADRGANLVRVRLWHTPPNRYSAFPDVQRTIRRARDAGMEILLDFHYSDHWADPSKQVPPAAWQGLTIDGMRDSVYAYTYSVLDRLAEEDLLPEMVQIGNEINPGFLLPYGSRDDWAQLGKLLQGGIRAVRDVAEHRRTYIDVMLHVAQPEHAMSWFEEAARAGVEDYDVMGLSYYAKWSSVPLAELSGKIDSLVSSFAPRDLLVVEAAYAWTLAGADSANNILDQGAVAPGYPATPEGQKAYLIDMTQAVLDGGGGGVVYWEPAWISTSCSTPWGKGSHWENAAFFDFNEGNEVLPGIDFLNHAYDLPEARRSPLPDRTR